VPKGFLTNIFKSNYIFRRSLKTLNKTVIDIGVVRFAASA
jgi:hypothetical protein